MVVIANLSHPPLRTCRENKNRYLFAYLKLLVDCGNFDHIYVNFLPVGHTHCDIDQLFSRIGTYLRGDNFLEPTMSGFL